MQFVRITKVFWFEAAHFLHNYKGPCSNIHGHSYKLEVCIGGIPRSEKNHPEDGLVIDFKKLKELVQAEVTDHLDHALIINSNTLSKNIEEENGIKKAIFTFQPTCENMVIHFSKLIKEKLPDGIKLISVRLWETRNSFAEWYSSDNPN